MKGIVHSYISTHTYTYMYVHTSQLVSFILRKFVHAIK